MLLNTGLLVDDKVLCAYICVIRPTLVFSVLFWSGGRGACLEGWAASTEEGDDSEEDGQGWGEEAASDEDQGPEGSRGRGQGRVKAAKAFKSLSSAKYTKGVQYSVYC